MVDLSAVTPIAVDVLTGLNSPVGIEIIGTEMYIVETGANKISKISINSLSTEDFLTKDDIKLYPNPTSHFIQISGLNKTENYKIYNSLGQEVLVGAINSNYRIETLQLINGLYFLEFDNGRTFKFIKE